MDGRFGGGDPHVEDHSDNDLAALERIRETIRGLSSGPTKAPQMLDVARAASPTPHEAPQHVRREDSFSSQGWNDGTFRDDVEKSAARHQPLKGDEMMPFGGEGSTVTLPSVAPSASGDSIFAAAPPGGHGARGPSGASGDMRVCVSDMRAKGLGPAGQGVTFCLKLQLNGFKARTALVCAPPPPRLIRCTPRLSTHTHINILFTYYIVLLCIDVILACSRNTQ